MRTVAEFLFSPHLFSRRFEKKKRLELFHSREKSFHFSLSLSLSLSLESCLFFSSPSIWSHHNAEEAGQGKERLKRLTTYERAEPEPMADADISQPFFFQTLSLTPSLSPSCPHSSIPLYTQGKAGNAAQYITRNQALKKLQLKLSEFR